MEAQANHSGYTLGEDANRLEKIKNARAMLFLHGVLTESENEKIIKRICDKVEKALKPFD
ncbi:hypothetical protein [Anaerostipes sp.]|uniref:hypothetical protein n=1 Tax=Anaerostipes sp. TaxID=1872530 RepID=UPI003993EE16